MLYLRGVHFSGHDISINAGRKAGSRINKLKFKCWKFYKIINKVTETHSKIAADVMHILVMYIIHTCSVFCCMVTF